MQVFNPPPNWPRPPEGWWPPDGWTPDPGWGPAPQGWQFFVDAPTTGAGGLPRAAAGEDENIGQETSSTTNATSEAGPRPQLGDRIKSHLHRAAIALVGLVAAGLLLPAATKQWSDRSSELSLKKDLLAQVNEVTTETVLAADCLSQLCMPELAPLRTTDPNSDISVEDVDPELWNEALVAASRVHVEIPRQWLKSRAVVQGSMDAYFAGTDAAVKWSQYADGVDAYMDVPDITCGDEASADLEALRSYLGDAQGFEWTDLSRAGLAETCDLPVEVFDQAYTAAGQQLLAARERVTQAIMSSHAEGYSDGLGDFLRDLWPL